MIPAYVPKYFSPEEFFPAKVVRDQGDLAWHLMNEQVLRDADMLREIYGPMFINTYKLSEKVQRSYGIRTESGLRIPGMNNYKPYSQHTFGRSFDAVFRDHTAEAVRMDLISGNLELGIAPVVIETGVSWLHWGRANYRGSQSSGIITVV